jgi:DNA invertase Pin-like site-specific DNA recombinase
MTSSSPTTYVAYYRVSTEKQGKTHLGLDAQKASIHAFLKQYGGTLHAEFTEVESGRNTERTELQKAMTMAKLTGGILLVAKCNCHVPPSCLCNSPVLN